jgi:hypothetical protein
MEMIVETMPRKSKRKPPDLTERSYRPIDWTLRQDGHRELDRQMDESIKRDMRNDGQGTGLRR